MLLGSDLMICAPRPNSLDHPLMEQSLSMLALRPTTDPDRRRRGTLAETLKREQKQKDEDDPRRPASASREAARRSGCEAVHHRPFSANERKKLSDQG
jgi:hypothetical protein